MFSSEPARDRERERELTIEPDGFQDRLLAALAAEATSGPVFLDGTGLGDGLPLIAPDDTALANQLAGRDPAAPAVTGPIPIAFAVPTWWDLAACAVLAGCRPGVLPLLAAAVDAATDPAFNLLGVQTTTGAAAPLLIVDGGRAVACFGLNAGPNALGPGARANATIGRAVRLLLQGVGRCAPGEGDMATHGHPGKYTWLVAANTADDPGADGPWADGPWADGAGGDAPPAPGAGPGADDRGVGRVTVFAGVGNVEVVLPTTTPEALAGRLAQVIAGLAAPTNLVLLPPESAGFLQRQGWDRSRLGAEVAALSGAEEPLVVVTGGTGIKATVVPGWGGGSQAVTRRIETG